MKTIVLFFIFITISCTSQKNKLTKNKVVTVKSDLDLVKTTPNKKQLNNCPADGICTIEILKNKSLVIKTDDIGAIYYQMEDNNTTSVIVYSYNKKTEAGLQDASYKEEIIFEISNSETKILLSNNDLQKTKMLFGRHCYCKGQAGYFKVTEGNLKLVKSNTKTTLNLDFKVKQVPQIITSIDTTF